MGEVKVRFPRPCAERWEVMVPAGRDRVCATCDAVVHDLSTYSFEDAAALLAGNAETCVRAHVDRRGEIALKPDRESNARRMVVAIGTSATLLVASVPAIAGPERARGMIEGTVSPFDSATKVTATASDGNVHHARVKRNGRYRFKRLPAGTYDLTFVPDCGDRWTVPNVQVEESRPSVLDTADPNQCIIVGLLRLDDGSDERRPLGAG